MSASELDVFVVGAGLSGIGAAWRLKTELPRLRFALLEARSASGGTWDLFRYPGVRSDSDMLTLGYSFRPWTAAQAIAPGPDILRYLRESAEQLGIEPLIRYQHRVVEARWSSPEARWTLEVEVGPERRREQLRCRFLYLCSGYYDYARAHAPRFPGALEFRGRLVHPQWWPEGLDCAGKKVVVIGSGATAVTLVPALAGQGAQVTMLQRSPTWIVSLPNDVIARAARALLPPRLAYALVRAKNTLRQMAAYAFCRWWPEAGAALMLRDVARHLPEGYPVERHFMPRYPPWAQRVCFVPDADLFKAISSGRAHVVTDTIERFTEKGIQLTSGQHLDADVIVTATGLKLLPAGGVRALVDGQPVRLNERLVYRGMMLDGVPNLAWCVGYTNASWTLRADLVSRWVCRLLKHLERSAFDTAAPRAAGVGPGRAAILDLQAGYITRSLGELPLQGTEAPWLVRQNYLLDYFVTRFEPLDDGVLEFSRSAAFGLPVSGR